MIEILKEKKTSGKKRLLGLFSGSLILNLLSRLSDKIYESAANSLVGRFLTGGGSGEESTLRARRSRTYPSRLKRTLMQGFEKSAVIGAISRIMKSLLSMTFKYYGFFFLSFGLLSSISSFVVGVPDDMLFDSIRLGTGITMIIISVVMFFSDMKVGAALCESRFADLILFRFLKVRRDEIELGGREHKGGTAVIFGVILGLVSFVVHPLLILLVLAAVVVMYIVMRSPETGVLLIMAFLPFLTTMMLVGVVGWTLLSFFIKVIRGKRTVRFESIDIFVILFMLMTALGGIVSVSPQSSIKAALVFVCFMFGYFLVVNLINTTERIERCIHAMVFSSLFVALYGIFQYVTGSAQSLWQDTSMFSDISGRVVSTFANPNVLAEYLIMVLPFAAAMMITNKRGAERAFYLLTFGCLGLCLVFTWSRGAWLGFLCAAMLFVLIWSRKFMILGFLGIACVPLLPFVLPSNVVSRFTSIGNLGDSSTSYRVSIWRGVMSMLRENFVTGIGIGEGAFSAVYPRYSHSGIELAPHSHNLFFQITTEIGIVGLIVFLIIMLLFARKAFGFFAVKQQLPEYSEREGMRLKMISAAGLCGIVAMLLQGITDYVWYNYRVFLMFWIVIGLTVTVGRTVKNNRTSSYEKTM